MDPGNGHTRKGLHILFLLIFLVLVSCAFFSNKGKDLTKLISHNSSSQLAQVIGSNLIAHYSFDEGSGTIVGDSVGSNTGTLTNGPTWTSGKIGSGAVSFDGSNDFVKVAHTSILDPGEISISFWVNPSSSIAGGGSVIQKGNGSGTTWRLYCYTASPCSLRLLHNGQYGATSPGLTPNVWNHVVLTGNSSGTRLYVNGVAGALDTDPWTAPSSRNDMLVASALQAQIDDMRIYSKALTFSEISEIYSVGGGIAPLPSTDSGPVSVQPAQNPPPTTNPPAVPPTTTNPNLSAECTSANLRCVDDTPGATQEYTSIQSCANVAQAGDTCLVYPGTYPEHVITKFGGTSDSQRIIFKANGLVSMQGFQIAHQYITVDGFDITGFNPIQNFEHIDVMVGGNYCQILNNTIRDGSLAVAGINFPLTSTLQSASNCLIRGNTLKNLNATFFNIQGSYHTIENNIFERLNNRDFIFVFGHDHVFRRNIFREGNKVAGINNHADFIQTFPDKNGKGESYNMLFEENWIENVEAQFSQLNSGAGGKLVYPSTNFNNWTFRRNVFINISGYGGIGIPKVRFENNTFYKFAYEQGGLVYSGSLGRGEASYEVLKNNVFLEGGNTPTAANGISGFYGIAVNFGTEALRLFVTLEDWTNLNLTECQAAPIACGIFTDLKLGYINTSGLVTHKFSVLSGASQFVLPDAFVPYRDQIFTALKSAETTNTPITVNSFGFLPGNLRGPVMSELQRGYVDSNGILLLKAQVLTDISQFALSNAYSSYKTETYKHLLMTKELDKSFSADYNYVGGARSAGYPKKNSVCTPGANYTSGSFCEPHGINGGDPKLVNISDPDGPDDTPFTADDGLRPITTSGNVSPLCGRGEGGSDIGAYSCFGAVGPAPSGDRISPNVSITAPNNGTVATGVVTITASASDNIGVSGVQFKVNGTNLGSENTSSPYSTTWNTSSLASGTYTLTATARDDAGNITTSQPVIVTVGSIQVAQDLHCAVGPKTIRAHSIVQGNSIQLVWPKNDYRQELRIARRVYSATSNGWQNWTEIHAVTDPAVAKNASQFSDTNIANGVHYEYQLSQLISSWTCNGITNNPTWSYQYINTGINVPLNDHRGKVILLVESSIAEPLASEISRLENDLIGDGYKVYRHDVAAAEVGALNWKASVAATKALIRNDYTTDTSGNWSIFIVGHVPIPYSGLSSPGAHTENFGAHPADWYYADMDEGGWTDTTVNDTTAQYQANHNIPGDGKFDQTFTPSAPELRIGRIDLKNMPAFGKSEIELLRQYLNRDHAWRHKQFTVRDRALVNSNNNLALIYEGRPFESHSVFSSFFGGTQNTDLGSWLDDADRPSKSYLFAASNGNGLFTRDHQIGTTQEFATNPLYVTFTSMYGSYYGDWNSAIHPNIVLLAPLAAQGYVLNNYYREYVMNIDSSSMNEPIAQELFAMASNQFPSIDKRYRQFGQIVNGSTFVTTDRSKNYVTLMGDPTLRPRVVAPPTNVRTSTNGADTIITWSPATDSNIQGYHVYRAPTTNQNNFTRVTNSPVLAVSWRDTNTTAGSYRYMVRTVKLEQSANRSYYNISQGIFANEATQTTSPSGSGGGTPTGTIQTTSGTQPNTVSGGGGGGGRSIDSVRPTITPGSSTIVKILTAPRSFGSSHEEIKKLQQFLNNNGYVITTTGPGSKGKETTYFGPATLKALNKFQIARKLSSRTLDLTTVNLINSLTVATTTPTVIPITTLPSSTTFTRTLSLGMSGEDVKALQIFLNTKGFTIATSGPGSKGNETTFFGAGTKAALIKFQEAYKADILTPNGLTKGTGTFGPASIKKVNALR